MIGAGERSLDETLAALGAMNVAQLRLAWRRLLESEPPPLRAGYFLRMELAWRLQARMFGDLDKRARRQLAMVARAKAAGREGGVRATRPKPGSTLVKEWGGLEHRVEVLADGYAYDGKRYKSLSAVARDIAGVRWSGPRFFGIAKLGARGA